MFFCFNYNNFEVKQDQKNNDRLLTIEQNRFFADGSQGDESTWQIPINICTKSNPNEAVHQFFLNSQRKQEFLLDKVPETDWIKLNLFRYLHKTKSSTKNSHRF